MPSGTTATAPTATPTSVAAPASPPSAHIVDRYIPYGPTRLAEMAAYSLRHYGTRTSRLTPSAVVLHVTGTTSVSSTIAGFAADGPDLGELPGKCAHYLVGQDGTVFALVPTDVRCRHAVGFDDQSIGIEIMQASEGRSSGWADQQILARPAQLGAALALVRMLQARYGIPDDRVVGHAMVNSTTGFHDLLGWRNDHTDWQEVDVDVFRSLLHSRHVGQDGGHE